MATSKTLTPTNVTIQIPAFADKPDQRLNSNCLDKEADAINALSDKIATQNLGSLANQSALESALVTLGGSMSDMQFKNVRFAFSAVPSSGVFNGKAGYYIGTFKRSSTNIYAIDVQNSGTGNQKGEHITGTYNGSAWVWEDLSDQIAKDNATIGSVKCYIFGNAVSISVAGAVTLDSNGVICNVASKYRPTNDTYFEVTTGSSDTKRYLAVVKNTGDIVIYNRADTVAYAYGSCSYAKG